MKWRDLAGCPNPPGFYQWDQQFVRSVMMSHSEIPLLFVNTSRGAGQSALAAAATQPSSAESPGSAWKWVRLDLGTHTWTLLRLWRADRPVTLRAHAQGCVHERTSRLPACACTRRSTSTLCTHLQKAACTHPDTYARVQKWACTHLCLYVHALTRLMHAYTQAHMRMLKFTNV